MNIGAFSALREPPDAERHVRWCRSWERVTAPGYLIPLRAREGYRVDAVLIRPRAQAARELGGSSCPRTGISLWPMAYSAFDVLEAFWRP